MFQGLATGPEFKVQSTNHVESKAHNSRRFIQASHRGGSKLRFGMIDRGYGGGRARDTSILDSGNNNARQGHRVDRA